MTRKLRNWLLAGLVVLLPVWLSIFLVFWAIQKLNESMEPVAQYIPISLPGLGILLALVLMLLVGWLTSSLVGRSVIRAGERAMLRIPVVRTLYSAVKQVTEAVVNPKDQAFSRVVLVEFPRPGLCRLGFVAGEFADSDYIRIWVPQGPSPTAGTIVMCRNSDVIAPAMSVEEGLKVILSAGVPTPRAADAESLVRGAEELRIRRQADESGGVPN